MIVSSTESVLFDTSSGARIETMMPRLLWSFLVLCLVMMDQTEGWRRRRRRRCPVRNCAVSSWTSWSTCTQACGNGGSQHRTRRVTQGPSCGGSCPYGLKQTRACNRHNCPGKKLLAKSKSKWFTLSFNIKNWDAYWQNSACVTEILV